MDFIEAFLGGAANTVSLFGAVLVDAATAVTNIVYTNTAGDGGQLTIVGAGLSLAMGVGAVYLIFRMVRGLIKQNERG